MNIPEEWPTEEMIDAGWKAFHEQYCVAHNRPEAGIRAAFDAMLSAAPTPLPSIEVDSHHLAALALSGALGEKQTKEVLTAVFAPTPPEVKPYLAADDLSITIPNLVANHNYKDTTARQKRLIREELRRRHVKYGLDGSIIFFTSEEEEVSTPPDVEQAWPQNPDKAREIALLRKSLRKLWKGTDQELEDLRRENELPDGDIAEDTSGHDAWRETMFNASMKDKP